MKPLFGGDILIYIVSAMSIARGQEGEDHARREVFPLLTPLSLGFVSASEMEFVRTSLLLGAAIALSACA